MKQYVMRLIVVLSVLLFKSTIALAQDSCIVTENVRPDGLMMRNVAFEKIYQTDSIDVFAAMYAIDKSYYLVMRLQTVKDIKNYHHNMSIKMSDSTVVLLKFYSFNSDKQNGTYDIYFAVSKEDLGYIEKYVVLQLNYTIKKQIKSIRIKENNNLLMRHYACLRNK